MLHVSRCWLISPRFRFISIVIVARTMETTGRSHCHFNWINIPIMADREASTIILSLFPLPSSWKNLFNQIWSYRWWNWSSCRPTFIEYVFTFAERIYQGNRFHAFPRDHNEFIVKVNLSLNSPFFDPTSSWIDEVMNVRVFRDLIRIFGHRFGTRDTARARVTFLLFDLFLPASKVPHGGKDKKGWKKSSKILVVALKGLYISVNKML